MLSSSAIIAITTSSSISVKAFFLIFHSFLKALLSMTWWL
jgi:hypothetical protein